MCVMAHAGETVSCISKRIYNCMYRRKVRKLLYLCMVYQYFIENIYWNLMAMIPCTWFFMTEILSIHDATKGMLWCILWSQAFSINLSSSRFSRLCHLPSKWNSDKWTEMWNESVANRLLFLKYSFENHRKSTSFVGCVGACISAHCHDPANWHMCISSILLVCSNELSMVFMNKYRNTLQWKIVRQAMSRTHENQYNV